jgi:hypothetical protein
VRKRERADGATICAGTFYLLRKRGDAEQNVIGFRCPPRSFAKSHGRTAHDWFRCDKRVVSARAGVKHARQRRREDRRPFVQSCR